MNVAHDETEPRRMFKMAVQRGRSQRRGESYFFTYDEPLSAARTKLADFFNILLEVIALTTARVSRRTFHRQRDMEDSTPA